MTAQQPPVRPVTTRVGGGGPPPWIVAAVLVVMLASLAWLGLFGDGRRPPSQPVALPPIPTPAGVAQVATPSPGPTSAPPIEISIEFGQQVPRRFPVVLSNDTRRAAGGVGVGRYLVFIYAPEPVRAEGMVRLSYPDERGTSIIELLHVDRRPRDQANVERIIGRWDLALGRLSDALENDRILLRVTQRPRPEQAGAPPLVREGYELVVMVAGSRTIPLLLINVHSLAG